MNLRNDENKMWLRLTPSERARFNELWGILQNDCNISPKRQSEIIIEGFFQYAEHLISSYIPSTHTKTQSSMRSRNEAIFATIDRIKEKEYMFVGEAYSELIHMNECMNEVKMRTKASYFQKFLTNDELVFLYLKHYFDTNMNNPIVIIPKKSKWYPQLRALCFPIREPILKVTTDTLTDQKFKHNLFRRLKLRAKYKSDLDSAEKTMLNAFLYEIREIAEKPMYDAANLNIRTVIQLRSEYRFKEAQEIIDIERNQILDEKRKLKEEAIANLQNITTGGYPQ